MKVDLEKQWENRVQFSLSGASVPFANAIRRYASMRVPVIAMDKITIYDNTTSLFDEYIAHRFGLVPIKTPEKLPSELNVTFFLDEQGPKTVYSKDLKSSDSDIVSAKESIPLITLTDNQKIKIEAKASVGMGTKHAKYQAGVVAYEITEKEIRFNVETLFQMKPKELVLRACSLIEDDVSELMKELKKAAK